MSSTPTTHSVSGVLRHDGRQRDTLRPVSMISGVNPHAEGSCLVKIGRTEVLCTASLQTGVPKWMKGQKTGWLTAEYGMLPRSTAQRKDREAVRGKQEGRTAEIQRLIGRSLRSSLDLSQINGLTMWLDCDVLVADGGTRSAAISGAWVAATLAVKHASQQFPVKRMASTFGMAAISCGITSHGVILDMDYIEDSEAFADGNFVMNSAGHWVETQISAEKQAITDQQLLDMQHFARLGIRQIMAVQADLLAQDT